MVRFWNSDVIENLPGVIERIREELGRASLSAPGGGEGRGEAGDSRALADTHLTLPLLRNGPLPLPVGEVKEASPTHTSPKGPVAKGRGGMMFGR